MNNPTLRRRHPARGARQNTALFSAAAFIGLGAGLAVQNSVGTANSATTTVPDTATTVPVTTGPATTVAITTAPAVAASAQESDDSAPTTSTPTVATPPPAQAQPASRARPAPQAKTGGS